jgi:hypothetical protein
MKASSGNEAGSECLNETDITFVFIFVFWRPVDRRDCCFSYVVFKRDASTLSIDLSIFCSYLVFDGLFNYYCGASVCCLIWVSGR